MHRSSASLTRPCLGPAERWDSWGMLPSWRQTPNLQPQSQFEVDLFCTPDRQFIPILRTNAHILRLHVALASLSQI